VHNQKIWFYRIIPSCKHSQYKKIEHRYIVADFSKQIATPERLRWKPFPLPKEEEQVNFLDGLRTLGGSGSAETKTGFAVHIYSFNASMKNKAFVNSDGDLLIVPQLGDMVITTECGLIELKPGELAVIQRGHKFKVDIPSKGNRRGYVCEVFDGHYILPDLGPIGANGLANPRDFLHPVAHYEDEEKQHTLIQKFLGDLYTAELERSPFDVVAWHGNYVPYKYDMRWFVAVNSVTVDHMVPINVSWPGSFASDSFANSSPFRNLYHLASTFLILFLFFFPPLTALECLGGHSKFHASWLFAQDPSIFTVLTCQTTSPGVAAVDFVIFPPRMAVQKNTFRPPYYHRNCMSEFMV